MFIAQTTGIETLSYGVLFAKTVVIMVVIIGLAFVSIKYLVPRLVKIRNKKSATIEILDFLALEQRKAIYVVRIEEKKLALAVTDHAVAKLCEWDESAPREAS
ncbi:MAG: hypothetical protein ACD_62C00495G0002 [uncultured bacterium]|nr:MAG: hypothetical protein ACD_62C00495G0002 [uncultured bacterium]HLD44935.1 flagellar biosynthetic protein FliO [bacterium]